jgi:hypothetical protein
MSLAYERVIDIPSQNIYENILVYEPFGREDTCWRPAVVTHTWVSSWLRSMNAL